jgi:tetratricopeptide (TPR) repeat protein
MDRPSLIGRATGAGAGPLAVLGLACLVPLVVGCQTVNRHGDAHKALAAGNAAAAGAAKSDAAVAKTDFRRDVTPDQQYNVHLELGHVFDAQQQYEAALAEYQKSLDACAHRGFVGGAKGNAAKQAMVHRRMGQSLDRMGRFAQAEVHYRAALKLCPDDPKVLNDAGYSYYLQSRWADAERTFKTAAKIAPNDYKVQTNLGLTLAAIGKTDEALAALSHAGGPAVGHANLAFLLAAKGQVDQARHHYQEALRLQPKLATARQALLALGDKKTLTEQPIASAMPMPSQPIAPAMPTLSQPVASAMPKPSQPIASAIPMPPLPPGMANVTDVSVKRTSGPRVIPLAVTTPIPPPPPLPPATR